MKKLRSFFRDELGAEVAEHAIIVMFVAIAGAAVYASLGNGVTSIWSSGNQILVGSSANSGSPVDSGASGGASGSGGGWHDCHGCDRDGH